VNMEIEHRFIYNVGEILEQLRNWRLVKKGSIPWS
jgi:hypothetical protein